ncbi:MAG: oxygenase MpaB family protein [Pseudomonadota bacterium]|nr:oxygenase MpaB family protein [Pseudomonadota bacterium]
MTDLTDSIQLKVANQRKLIPTLYGDVDMSIVPYRFAGSVLDQSLLPASQSDRRIKILRDLDRVERFSAYTMLGDTVSDAYAALLPSYGFRRLIDMLITACDKGIAAVPNAPPELNRFMDELAHVPDWLDLDLVEEGARYTRIHMAIQVPFVIRGVFIATFTNQYSGLPMALTGTLAGQSAARRMQETANFFTTACLPGALQRYGMGFKSAAMVRLMHSMVRFNLLTRSKRWDVNVYGIPIPQIDQMPAGMVPALLLAAKAIRRRSKSFTSRERAVVELCRYQSYLLGLPQELLPATPAGILDVITTYYGTLRDGYDDATCGALARATMAAYRPSDRHLRSRLYNSFECSFSRVYFERLFPGKGRISIAKRMGIESTPMDYLKFSLTALYLAPQVAFHSIASRLPLLAPMADNMLIRRIHRLLMDYGHARYTTDAAAYTDGHNKADGRNRTDGRDATQAYPNAPFAWQQHEH